MAIMHVRCLPHPNPKIRETRPSATPGATLTAGPASVTRSSTAAQDGLASSSETPLITACTAARNAGSFAVTERTPDAA